MTAQELTVGQYLQRQREAQKISLESVANITRIRIANLEALEKDEFHLLPAEVFTRGFLRSYAKSIGLNADEILSLYHRQMKGKRSQEPGDKPKTRRAASFFKYILNCLMNLLAMISIAPSVVSKSFLSPKD